MSTEAPSGQSNLGNDLNVELLEPIQFPLAKKFYQECRYHSGIDRQDKIWVLRQNKQICGALRLTLIDQSTLLRSMVIHPDHRKKGLGSHFLKAIEGSLPEECWCFPFNYLDRFYGQINFLEVTPENATKSILEKYSLYQDQGRNILLMLRAKSS